MRRHVTVAAVLCLWLPLLLLSGGCKGRTTAGVEPDGSAPEEVRLMETPSATEARDSLRDRVKAMAPERGTESASENL